jgi:hypothetical protein
LKPPKIEITLSRDGTIILTGEDLEKVLSRDKWAELWHSQPDQGLAIRFLSRPGPTALTLEPDPDKPDRVSLKAREFLTKVGFDLPSAETGLKLGVWDSGRRVLTCKKS